MTFNDWDRIGVPAPAGGGNMQQTIEQIVSALARAIERIEQLEQALQEHLEPS